MSETMIRPGAPMCLVLLRYVAELAEVDAHRPAHVDWLAQGIEQGVVVLAGRQTPPTGGVLLFHGEREAVAALAASDPFVIAGVATFELVAFTATLAAAGMAGVFE
ncbi:YciI family protein [Sphingomonas sp. 37zxx]|uniref:YciI family protein n=1 Tax=Sphingomonas sp. 37zxx TaxID=1550073 RepID=UPI0006897B5A|nr:YciI family protein [Sphingomonas sp. 37zxx]